MIWFAPVVLAALVALGYAGFSFWRYCHGQDDGWDWEDDEQW